MNERIAGLLVKSQQYYLKEMGFYKGPIDGAWGDECRQAMRQFKQDPQFSPAIKRDDLPFIPFDRLPQGFKWEVIDGQRAIIKMDNLHFVLVVQNLLDGITGVQGRDAYDALGEKRRDVEEQGRIDSISDYV